MRCCCPALPGQKNTNAVWIWVAETELSDPDGSQDRWKTFYRSGDPAGECGHGERSVALNGLQDRIDIVEGDIRDASKIFGASSFHVVTTNPPYMTAQHGLTNLYEAKTIARHEVLCNLEDIIRESARLLMPGGRFYMVHRPFRLAEIISLMVQYRMEPKRMRLVYPYVDREPNMVLIEGLRGGKSRMTVEKPLIVYKEPGKYTDEIYDVYGY